MSEYKRRGRLGSLFWDDNSNISPGSLKKPLVILRTLESKNRRLSTIESRAGQADMHDIVQLQTDVDILLENIDTELKNALSIGTCTTNGACKIGKLISEFVDTHQAHIITNFPTHITREVRTGVDRHHQKIWDADIGRLIILYKNINSKYAIAYPELWKVIRNKLMQLEKANQLVTFTNWYKKNYTKSYAECDKKIGRLLK